MSFFHETFARFSGLFWPGVADHLWQSTLFAFFILGLTLIVRNAPARVRHGLWLVALAKFALPSSLFSVVADRVGLDVGTFFSSSNTADGASVVLQFAEPLSSLSDSIVVTEIANATHRELYCFLTLLWVLGCFALSASRLRSRYEFLKVLRAGREVYSGREFEALENACRRLGTSSDVRLVVSPFETEPGVWRTRTPIVVLPDAMSTHLDDEELEVLMLHEMSHIERRDNLVGSLQALLTCLFWFCPPVWLVGRRIVEERERACDERVLEAGGPAGAYASSILKVVRFCTGWRVAGVAGAAAGSNLRRRIETIMSGNTLQHSKWQRTFPVAAVLIALMASVGAGLYSYGQSTTGRRAGSTTTRATAQGGVRTRTAPATAEEAAAIADIVATQESLVTFENAGEAPVIITEARMRQVTREQLQNASGFVAQVYDDDGQAQFFLTLPSVTIANYSSKPLIEVGIAYVVKDRTRVITGYRANAKGGETQTFRSEWNNRNILIAGALADTNVQIVWAEFADGTSWGRRSWPKKDINTLQRTDVIRRAPKGDDAPGQEPVDVRTGAPSTGVGAGSQSSEDLAVPRSEGSGVGVGVGVSGGPTARTPIREVNGGILNRRIQSTPNPIYPEVAKAARAQGTVAVRIVVDEEGNVISATAETGHPLLRSAAVDAARQAKFAPTRLNGQPVKVTGHVTYNFVLEDKEVPEP